MTQPSAEIRLPLQIGTTSLWSLGRAAFFLAPALAFLPVGLGLVIFAGAGLVVIYIGIVLAVYGAMHLYWTVRERPSDVLLSASGLRIDGGRLHGRAWPWHAIDVNGCRLDETKERRLTLLGIALAAVVRSAAVMGVAPVRVQRLQLGLRGAPPIVVAQAERPIEMESLQALLDSIRIGPWTRGAGPDVARERDQARARQSALGIVVVACPRCGAPVPPLERPVVPCRYCSTQVAIPPELAARIAAARAVSAGRSATSRVIGALLRQPGAHATNLWLTVGGVLMMGAWPLALLLVLVRAATETFTPWDVLFMPLVPLCFIPALFVVLRRRLVDRQALRLLTVDFGARAPERPGDPHRCRHCQAPLPDRGGEIAVDCVYCGAGNVLGLDLRGEATPTLQQAQGLEHALAARGREAQLWGLMTVIAVLLFLGGSGALAMSVGGSMLLPSIESTPPPKATAAPTAPPATAPPKPIPSPPKPPPAPAPSAPRPKPG